MSEIAVNVMEGCVLALLILVAVVVLFEVAYFVVSYFASRRLAGRRGYGESAAAAVGEEVLCTCNHAARWHPLAADGYCVFRGCKCEGFRG